jgi:hypothetical protein
VIAGRPLPQLASDQRYCRNMVNPRGSVDIEGGTLSGSPACWAWLWIVPLSTRPALRINSRYASCFHPTIPLRLDQPRLTLARPPPLGRQTLLAYFKPFRNNLA